MKTENLPTKSITMKRVCQSFEVHPSYLYALKARGILPEKAVGTIPSEWLRALAGWFTEARGDLPAAAVSLCEQAGVTL